MNRIYENRLTSADPVATETGMGFAFDSAKDALNFDKHGLSLADFEGFDAEPIVLVDDRFDYGEVRYRALGFIDGQPHVIVYTLPGDDLRLISFRRAHAKEGRLYERRSKAP